MTWQELQNFPRIARHNAFLVENEVRREITRQYKRSWLRIADAIDKTWIETQSLDRDFRLTRLTGLQRQIDREMARFADASERAIWTAQRNALARGEYDILEYLRTAYGEAADSRLMASFIRVPTRAVEQITGFMTVQGSPLRNLLSTVGGHDVLVSGVIQGFNPRKMAREFQAVTDQTYVRSLRIARTEVLRAYRQASHVTMEQNTDVVNGWTWHATLTDDRTCVVCIAMHGSFHPVTEDLNDHVNGRCVAIPRTKSYDDLGFSGIADTRPMVERGDRWFDSQSDDYKQSILGKSAFEAYKDGRVSIQDFVTERQSGEWPSMKVRDSLDRAIARHGTTNPLIGEYLIDAAQHRGI